MNKRFPKRCAKASQVAAWENEGGGIPAGASPDSSRDSPSQEMTRPFQVNDLARVTLDSIADAVISTDCDGNISYMNATAVEMTGWSLNEAVGQTLADVFTVIDATTGRPARDPGLHAVEEGHAVKLAVNSVLVQRDGSEVEIEDSAAPIYNREGRLVGAVIVFRDVRFSHAMVERMLFLARQDPLTGRANRYSLAEQFDLARRLARRNRRKIGVLFIDVDRFKSINDTLGHEAGDQVLVSVAQRLAGCLREADTLCRYGGDEFVVLLGGTACPRDVERVVDKLRAAMAKPEIIAGQALDLSLSIGVGLYPDDGEELDALIRQADRAMFRSKAMNGRSATAPFARARVSP